MHRTSPSRRPLRFRTIPGALVLALLMALVPAAPASATAPVTYQIAVAVPLTQGATALGAGIARGAQLASVHYNGSQRFSDLGIQVGLVSYDDKGDPAWAVTQAGEITNNSSSVGVVGHLNSGCSIPASNVYATSHLAMVSPSSTNPVLTSRGLDNVFRVCTTDAEQAPFAAARAADGLLLRRAVVVDDSTPYGSGIASVFTSAFRARGGSVLATYHTSDTQTSFTSVVGNIARLRPDVVYYGGIYYSGSLLAKQMKDSGYRVPILGSDGLYSPSYISRQGAANAEGDFATTIGYEVSQLPQKDRFLSEFSASYPDNVPAAYDAYGYDAASAICEAIASVVEAGDAVTRENVRAALAQASFDGITGPVAFDSHGDTTNKVVTMLRVRSGAWEPSAWTGTPRRLQGAGRYETALAVSRASFPTTAPAVVLATGGDFPDALAAGPLARAYGGPVLLVPPSGITPAIATELARLSPAQVFIIGSTRAVPGSTEVACRALESSPTVTRLQGIGRCETAAEVARQLKTRLGETGKVVVVTGWNFPDALSAAPLAASQGWPILLTRPSALPPATAQAIADVGATSTLVVGSEKVVFPTVADHLPSVERVKGGDRYGTCAAVLDYAQGKGHTYDYLCLVTGGNYPDALAAGPLVASQNGMLVLVGPSLSPGIASRCVTQRESVTAVDVVGGASALSNQAASHVLALF